MSSSSKKLYADKKKAGVCCSSGCKDKAVENRSLCEKHLQLASKRALESHRKKMKEGICVYGGCFLPAEGDMDSCAKHHKQRLKRSKESERKCRLEVMTRYCGGTPCCQCPGCDITFMGFLQMDHVKGGGGRHRTENLKYILRGHRLICWLKKNGYPDGFQVLCANCNSPGAKGFKRWCPLKGKPHHE